MRGAHPNPYVRVRPELSWQPPGNEPRSRVINGKVWDLASIHTIAKSQVKQADSSLIVPVTDKCSQDIQKLELTNVDLAMRLLRLGDQNYVKSMWCRRSVQPGVKISQEMLWLPCDAYVLTVEERISTGWVGSIEYYFKLCLSPSSKVILLVSLHLS